MAVREAPPTGSQAPPTERDPSLDLIGWPVEIRKFDCVKRWSAASTVTLIFLSHPSILPAAASSTASTNTIHTTNTISHGKKPPPPSSSSAFIPPSFTFRRIFSCPLNVTNSCQSCWNSSFVVFFSVSLFALSPVHPSIMSPITSTLN